MKAMILAAGLGTRLLPFTRHTPKPLFTLDGTPLLALVLAQLQRAGCRSVVINTHHLADRIAAMVQSLNHGMAVRLVHEPEILGTGGALRNVADFWADGPLLVINADIVTDIDLAAVWQSHYRDGHPVTMVMHDHPDYNTVRISPNDFVVGFDAAEAVDGGHRAMAFTGIHVVTPRVLDYLPVAGQAHIIDAYGRMLGNGERIKAHVVRGHYWRDIGTPEAYLAAAYERMAPAAFAAAFGTPPEGPIERRSLQGDGSDRQWYRIASGARSLILVEHGIRTRRGTTLEVDAFVAIGRHLHARGAAVPCIHGDDTFAGLVFLEDLGDCHLQTAVQGEPADAVARRYRQVIDEWITMATAGAHGFDTAWTWQSAAYDRELILERECRYFMDAFVRGYMGLDMPYEALATEFEQLADLTLSETVGGFLHRDLQSRNIMIRPDGRIGFIDFQGGRLGPLQYDLASLLIDPYVALPQALQDQLLEDAARLLQRRAGSARRKFRRGYKGCAVTRNLQILGAFGHLTSIKGKRWFADYIPTALAALRRGLTALAPTLRLPGLSALAAHITPTPPTPDQGGVPCHPSP